jgi:hypothetical protein
LGSRGTARDLEGQTRLEIVGVVRQIVAFIEVIHALSRRCTGKEAAEFHFWILITF